jgi:nucleoid DNA-binding protein
VYFKELSKKLKPSTIWSVWSILKSTLNTRDNVNINNFLNLKALVKNNSKGSKPKKSSVLKWDEILKFINNAPDYVHLASKVSIYINFYLLLNVSFF